MMKSIEISKELTCYPERFRRCNSYLLSLDGHSILFDPSYTPDMLPGAGSIMAVYATHAHYDHIGAVNVWKEEMPSRIFAMHGDDVPMLDNTMANASALFGRPTAFRHPDRLLEDGEELILDDRCSMTVIHTPGHTMGSSCFLIHKRGADEAHPLALITGDTLFDCGWGRTDFITGDEGLMRQSLKALHRLLSGMPADLPVCPGHGSITTASQACLFLQSSGFSG